MSFENKNIVITGAGSGIGRAIAEYYIEQGAIVACLDYNEDSLNDIEKSCINKAGKIVSYKVDVSSKTNVDKALDSFIKEYSDIDYLVNGAGISKIIPFLETSEEVWDATMNINLKGQFLVCQKVISSMLKKKKGAIVNISSQSGKKGTNSYAPYCASKAGVIALTQSIAKEFAEYNIRCNSICPGVIYTPMWEAQVYSYAQKKGIEADQVMPNFIKDIPLHRLGTTEDVTKLVNFLLSDNADYITGQAINLTGGSWMW